MITCSNLLILKLGSFGLIRNKNCLTSSVLKTIESLNKESSELLSPILVLTSMTYRILAFNTLKITFSKNILLTERLVTFIWRIKWFYDFNYTNKLHTFFKLIDFLTSKGSMASNLYFLLNFLITIFLPKSIS